MALPLLRPRRARLGRRPGSGPPVRRGCGMDEVVAVSAIATGGDGVGRLSDGRAVFVARTAPGELVRRRPQSGRMHKRSARGEVAEIVAPAATRVAPACPHYDGDRCGGCQLQHLDSDAQLDAKRDIVIDTLRRIGKLEVPEPTLAGATTQWRYHTRLSLIRSGGRVPVFGLPRYDRPGAVFRLTDCLIADPRLVALWHELERHLELIPQGTVRLTLRLDRAGLRNLIVESAGEAGRDGGRPRGGVAGGGAG